MILRSLSASLCCLLLTETARLTPVKSDAEPDLRISAREMDGLFIVAPNVTSPGGYISIGAFVIGNAGASDAGPFSVSAYLSPDPAISNQDVIVATVSVVGLQAGTTTDWQPQEITIPPTLAAGTYYVGVLVDDGNAVGETNETNNVLVTDLPITVRPRVQADLRTDPVLLKVGNVITSGTQTAIAAPNATV